MSETDDVGLIVVDKLTSTGVLCGVDRNSEADTEPAELSDESTDGTEPVSKLEDIKFTVVPDKKVSREVSLVIGKDECTLDGERNWLVLDSPTNILSLDVPKLTSPTFAKYIILLQYYNNTLTIATNIVCLSILNKYT